MTKSINLIINTHSKYPSYNFVNNPLLSLFPSKIVTTCDRNKLKFLHTVCSKPTK